MYEYICLNCGKKHIERSASAAPKKFCDRRCWKEYQEKKQSAAAAAAARVAASDKRKPLVDPKFCRKCKYRVYAHDQYACGYQLITGTSRTALHPEGLTSVCHEFEPRQRKHRYQAPIK